MRSNAELKGSSLHAFAALHESGRALLQTFEKLQLSARGYSRILRVSGTADVAGAETVGRVHIAEALSYRLMTG